MAQLVPSDTVMNDSRYRCVIKQVAPYGMYVEILEMKAVGVLRITELTNPDMLQDRSCVGTEIVARILGKETHDGPFILTQHEP
jgi:hypothetical protein